MKALLSTASIAVMMIFAAACMQKETMVLLDEQISEVNVSVSKGAGEMNQDILFSFTDQDETWIFEQAIKTAVKDSSSSGTRETPDYDLAIEYGEEFPPHGIHLWLGEEETPSTFSYVTDDAVFLTSTHTTNKLRKLILSRDKKI
ncbi:hypothetical protein [Metabacillus sp. 84]|uniref:hypothetical protein n=1 Tax=unclassified Metabacillus TaxID=2675274 RepID=UPI003CF0278D